MQEWVSLEVKSLSPLNKHRHDYVDITRVLTLRPSAKTLEYTEGYQQTPGKRTTIVGCKL